MKEVLDKTVARTEPPKSSPVKKAVNRTIEPQPAIIKKPTPKAKIVPLPEIPSRKPVAAKAVPKVEVAKPLAKSPKPEIKPQVAQKVASKPKVKAVTLSQPEKFTKAPAADIQKVYSVHTPYIRPQETTKISSLDEEILPSPDLPKPNLGGYQEVAHEADEVPPEPASPTFVDRRGPDLDATEVEQPDFSGLVAAAQQEIGVLGLPDDAEFQAEFPQVTFETDTPGDETAPQPIQDWLPQKLEQLGPEEAEAVEPVFAAVVQLIENLQALKETPDEQDNSEVQIIEQVLEEWVGRLLEQLDIRPDTLKIAQFIRLVKERQAVTQAEEGFSIRQLNALGTYEYKQTGLLDTFNDLLQDVKRQFHWVGRYSIRLHYQS